MEEKNHGGKREGAGRKPKVDELKFIEKLDNIIDSDEAIEKLMELIKDSNFNALKLYIEYRFGKPKETIENINHNFNQDLTDEEAKKINDILEDKY
jgi:hypothetical protein